RFGYFGPTSPEPDPTAVHLGDDLWLQFYIRNDIGMLNIPYNTFLAGLKFTTPAAGSTTVNVFSCNVQQNQITYYEMSNRLPANYAIGKHIHVLVWVEHDALHSVRHSIDGFGRMQRRAQRESEPERSRR